MFDWESRKEKILRGMKIFPAKKLEAIRSMNELADMTLTRQQKRMRRSAKKND